MTYLGAKTSSGLWQVILNLMPPHDTYIEAFAGSAEILARKEGAARSILVELDAAQVDALRLAGLAAEIHHADALAYLAGLQLASLGRVVIYADPPYVHSTRGERRYRHDMTDADHVALIGELRRLAEEGAAVILSGYPSRLYDRLLGDWNTLEFQVMTRGGARTEKLWFNLEPGARHWVKFAGRDFTDRQRIQRKAGRWARMISEMPAAERQAVLAAILKALIPP